MNVLFKKDELNKKFVIKNEVDQVVYLQPSGYHGPLSGITDEKTLEHMVSKGSQHVGLKAAAPVVATDKEKK